MFFDAASARAAALAASKGLIGLEGNDPLEAIFDDDGKEEEEEEEDVVIKLEGLNEEGFVLAGVKAGASADILVALGTGT